MGDDYNCPFHLIAGVMTCPLDAAQGHPESIGRLTKPRDARRHSNMRLLLATLVTVVAAAASAVELRAQTLPAGPIRAFDGKLTLSGQLVATAGARRSSTTRITRTTRYE